MERPKTKPVESPAGDHTDRGVERRHPAFGMVSFSRIQGSSGKLFGSELETDHFIRLQVHEGSDVWNLHQHWYHPEKLLLEVDMTAAQFAELLTTLNHGSGIPCTIRYTPGVITPDFEAGETLEERIKDDLQRDVKDVYGRLKKLREDTDRILSESGLGKAKKEKLTGQIDALDREIRANMPFVIQQYHEQVDKVKAHAAAEIDAMLTHAITKLGARSLQQIITAGDHPDPLGLQRALQATGPDPAAPAAPGSSEPGA